MEAFQLRLWDGRIGRWLSPDPYGQYASPYLGMGNNPISLIDPDGGQTIDPPIKEIHLEKLLFFQGNRIIVGVIVLHIVLVLILYFLSNHRISGIIFTNQVRNFIMKLSKKENYHNLSMLQNDITCKVKLEHVCHRLVRQFQN